MQMKKKMLKKAKQSLLCFLAISLCVEISGGLTSVIAHERELISDAPRHGEYFNQNVSNDSDGNSETVKIGDPEAVEREPEVINEVEDYSESQELVEKRTENTKTFELKDGTRITKQYFEPIHKFENGKWVDINDSLLNQTTLLRSKTNEFKNEEGIFPVIFNDKNIDVNGDIELTSDGDMSSFAVKENAVLYNNVNKDIDVQYSVRSNNLFQDVKIFNKDSNTFIIKLKTDLEVKEKDGNLYIEGDNKYILTSPILKDKNGKVSANSKVDLEKNENEYVVTYTADKEFLDNEKTAYPVKMSNTMVKNTELAMDTSYIRSGSPMQTSLYEHLMVGYDKDGAVSGLGSPDLIQIARSFFTFDLPKLEANRKLVSADLVLDKFSDYGNLEVPQIDVYDTNGKVDANTVNWNNQPANVTKISSNSDLQGMTEKRFDITKAAEKMVKGTPTSIELRANDESNKYYMIAFHSESTGKRPYIEVTDRPAYDFDPDMDINKIDENFRYYTKGYNHFEGISIDGIAKPYSDVIFDLYEKSNDKETLIKTTSVKSDAYKVQPIFAKSPIDGVQRYEVKPVSYTTDYLKLEFFPKKDTLYTFHVYAKKGDLLGEQLITDSFLFYQVKLGDNLQNISTRYGISIEDILKYNNTSEKKVKEGDIIFICYPHENPYLTEDMYTPPSRVTKYVAKYKYRGPTCVGKCDVGDPISISTGNFYHQTEDFTMSDYDDIIMKRTYNSFGEANASIFGNGFNTTIEQYLSFDKNDNILYFASDGKIFKFDKQKNGYKDDENYRIEVKDNNYIVINKDTGEKFHFNEYGILNAIESKTGKKSEIKYDDFGKIKSVNFGNKSITVSYYPKRNLVKSITLPNGAEIQYKYDNKNNLIEFIDAVGNSEKYSYDKNGKMSSIIDKNGNKIAENTYNAEGMVLTQKDGNGNNIKFIYNDNSVKLEYENGETKTYIYDKNFNVSGIINGDDIKEEYNYDDNGNLISAIDGEGNKTLYTYDDKDQLLKQIKTDGTFEEYAYDKNGNIIMHRHFDGRTDTYLFDEDSNMTSKTDVNGLTTTFTYDDKGRVVTETDAKGVTKSYEYDGNQISKISISNGLVTEFVYDVMGNVISKTDNNGKSITYAYDNNNRILSKTDVYGKTESYAYDGNGNTIQYIDKSGAKTVNVYDKNNNLVKSTKGNLTSSSTYDELNRIITETDSKGLTKQYVYDAAGNILKEINEYGKETIYTYDNAGHKLTMIDVYGNKTTYQYDHDNLISEIDPLGNETKYSYDKMNRVTEVIKPNGKKELNSYDENGNITSTTDERGLKTVKEYDKFNRLIKEINGKGITTTYTYDAFDNLLEKKEDERSTKYTYDVYGNQLTETNAKGNVSSIEYDLLDRVIKEKDALGYVIEHKYDALNQEIETVDQNGDSTKKIYDLNGSLVQEIDALGNKTTYEYNDKGQCIKSINAKGVETVFSYDKYSNEITSSINDTIISSKEYDEFGRLIKEKTPNTGKAYQYDTYNRVIEESDLITGLKLTKEYDKFSNIIKESDNGGRITTIEYDVYNQPIKTTDAYGRVEKNIYDKFGQLIETVSYDNEKIKYFYDKWGNKANEIDSLGNETTYVYNALNQLIETKSPTGVVSKYVYDEIGRKISVWDSFTEKEEKFVYDPVGNIIESYDKSGSVTKNKYDANNQLIQTENALGQVTRTEYDSLGNVIKNIDAAGNTQQKIYNDFNLVQKEIDERGFATEYHYNDSMLVDKVIDKNKNTVTRSYDLHNRVKEEIDQNGNRTTYEYDLYGNVIKTVDPNGNISLAEYDALNNITKQEIPKKTIVNTYDKYGKLLTTKENDTITVNNEYDALNQLVRSENALNQVTLYEYDKFGNMIKENNEGYITENTYDAISQLVKVVENTDKITTYKYDVLGRTLIQKQNGKTVFEKEYDKLGNVLSVFENGLEKKYTYNNLNQIYQEKYPNNKGEFVVVYTNEYDETGNLIKITDPFNHFKVRKYSPYGELVSETDENGHTIKFDYDGTGNLKKVQNALDRVVNYEYDGNGNVTCKNINDKKATYEYDENNNLVKETNEYGKTNRYEYDADGNMISHEKPDGSSIKYSYDKLGNKLSEGSRKYTYDNHNNLLTSTYNGKTIRYSYDKFNNISQVIDANGNKITYKWDVFGNKTEISYKQTTIKYEYNEMNGITKISNEKSELASYTYDNRGNVISLKNGKTITNNEYDELNRKVSSVTKKGNKEISNTSYTYDGVGNILSETINGKKNTYTYDEMDELKESTKFINGKEVKTSYGYDFFGNKTEVSTNGEFKRYHYNENNELTNVYTKEGNTDIYYDKNGNMRDILYAGGAKDHYDYDEFGQLIKVSNSKDQSYEFEYDAEGDRIHYKKNVKDAYDKETWYKSLEETEFENVKDLLNDKNSNQTFDALRYQAQYHIDKDTCVLMPEYSDSDWYAKDFDYILDKTLENSEILATSDGAINIYGQTERLITEHKKSDGTSKTTRYINGTNNSVYAKVETEMTWTGPKESIKEINYTDFGYTNDIKSGFGYNGEVLDDTGLIYLRARYYNPAIGQFIQLDENRGNIDDVESQNRYSFAKQNPNKYIDKNGKFAIIMSDGGGRSSGGICGAVAGMANKALEAAKKALKPKKKDPRNMTSQERYNLWVGNDSWDNWIGGKPKGGGYYTLADAKQAEAKKEKVTAGNIPEESPKVETCPIKDVIQQYGSGILDGLQFVLDLAGMFGGDLVGTVCDGLNALISLLRNNVTEFVIGIIGVFLPIIAAATLKKIAKAEGYTKVISFVASKANNAATTISNGLRKIGKWVDDKWWIPNRISKAINSVCEKGANFISGLFSKAEKSHKSISSDPPKDHALKDGDQWTTGQNGRKELKPDIEYETSAGHRYLTDAYGRIKNASGNLSLEKAKRNKYAQKVAGRGDRLASDQGGHLIASIFNGSGDLDNLVAMDAKLNQGKWRDMEKSWVDLLNNGHTLEVNINISYPNGKNRPSQFIVDYYIDGNTNIRKIFNN